MTAEYSDTDVSDLLEAAIEYGAERAAEDRATALALDAIDGAETPYVVTVMGVAHSVCGAVDYAATTVADPRLRDLPADIRAALRAGLVCAGEVLGAAVARLDAIP